MRFWAAALIGALPIAAHSGRPMIADDASLTTAGACQVESWTLRSADQDEYWVVPACNPTGNFEWSAGFSRTRANGQSWRLRPLLQGKTLFRDPTPEQVGWGLAFGALWSSSDDPINGPATLYAYVPTTISFDSDLILLHANLGWLRNRLLNDSRATWALGSQFDLGHGLTLIGEFYGDDRSEPNSQLGVSYAFCADRIHLDLTRGQPLRNASGAAFFTVGINVYFPPF